jgi:hypothetical protein
MPLSREALYDVHSRNLAAVDRGTNRIKRAANRAVAQWQLATAGDLTKIYALLLAAKLEVRLRKLMYEAPAFTDAQRRAITNEESQDQQWLRAIDEAFKRRYGVRRLSGKSLDVTPRVRRDVLREAVKKDLAPIMRLRNRLAHGQWAVALTNAGDAVSKELDDVLGGLNVLDLKHQERLIDRLGDAISDLAVSRRTFERDFDSHFRAVEDARLRLATSDYDEWANASAAATGREPPRNLRAPAPLATKLDPSQCRFAGEARAALLSTMARPLPRRRRRTQADYPLGDYSCGGGGNFISSIRLPAGSRANERGEPQYSSWSSTLWPASRRRVCVAS